MTHNGTHTYLVALYVSSRQQTHATGLRGCDPFTYALSNRRRYAMQPPSSLWYIVYCPRLVHQASKGKQIEPNYKDTYESCPEEVRLCTFGRDACKQGVTLSNRCHWFFSAPLRAGRNGASIACPSMIRTSTFCAGGSRGPLLYVVSQMMAFGQMISLSIFVDYNM